MPVTGTRDLGRCALLAALLTLGLWAAGILPSGRAAALVILSLAPGAWIRASCRGVPLAVLAAVVLGFFFCSRRAFWLTYSVFFAWYAPLYAATEGKRTGIVFRLLAGQAALALFLSLHCLWLGTFAFSPWWILLGEAFLAVWDLFFSLCVRAWDAVRARLPRDMGGQGGARP